jgi:hypothetical protein
MKRSDKIIKLVGEKWKQNLAWLWHKGATSLSTISLSSLSGALRAERGFCQARSDLGSVFGELDKTAAERKISREMISGHYDQFLMERYSSFKMDSELVHCLPPGPNRHRPFFANISQRQIEQFEHRLIIRKEPAIFRDFAQAHI